VRGVPTSGNAYHAATTQAVQLGVEVKVDNREPRSLRSSKQEPGPELPSRNESRPAKGWQKIRQQPGVGERRVLLDRQSSWTGENDTAQ